MKEPLITVMVPCFNLGAFLDEAVESVLAQSEERVEVVVVDDGSDDPATCALLADYDRPRTRVVRTKNLGLAAARNRAITEARGRYLCALDADDRLHPEFFARALAELERDPELAFVSCWLETFGSEQWVWKQRDCGFPKLLTECTVATPALVRRSAVEQVGGYDESMPHLGYEDWDLWITLVEQGFRGSILPEVLFYYRRRPGSMLDVCTRGEVHLDLMRYLIDKHAQSYRSHLFDVLEERDAELGELLRTNYELEREIHSVLAPRLDRRSRELESMEQKLEALREISEHERELEDNRSLIAELRQFAEAGWREVDDLHASRSWWVTAPLRLVYEWILRRREGRP